MMPEIPWWNRFRIAPKTNLPSSGINFRLGIGSPIYDRLLFFVLLVVPGQTRYDLAQIGVLAIHDDLADDAAVLVGLVPINGDGFSEGQVTEMLL